MTNLSYDLSVIIGFLFGNLEFNEYSFVLL